ncbi:MAG: quinolinate synthase NadA [Candidatus Kapabacteria bacterium]|nr:quinolinate synthase NadA [Candidatus Kapabacteria bacterium]
MDAQINRFLELKKQRNAIVLAHYYQDGVIQDLADFLGDSLALARAAQNTEADVILFCGVHFMAETAKILNPSKKVIIPDMNAGCSLADSAPAEKFLKWKLEHPEHIFITYINCSTAVKALSDIICTSSNAEKIVRSVPADKKICFAPDKFLGRHIIKQTGREMELWEGSCQVHEYFSEIGLMKLSKEHPTALILAHPECPENLLNYADYVGSTTGILEFALNNDNMEFIILTEPGIIHQLEKNASSKRFIPVPHANGCSCNECPYMKLNTLEKMIVSLETLQPEIILDDNLRLQALKPLLTMLELS